MFTTLETSQMQTYTPFSLRRRFSRVRSTSSWMSLMCWRTWKKKPWVLQTVARFIHLYSVSGSSFSLTLLAHCLHCFSSRQSPAALARPASSGLSFRSNHFRLWEQRHTQRTRSEQSLIMQDMICLTQLTLHGYQFLTTDTLKCRVQKYISRGQHYM